MMPTEDSEVEELRHIELSPRTIRRIDNLRKIHKGGFQLKVKDEVTNEEILLTGVPRDRYKRILEQNSKI